MNPAAYAAPALLAVALLAGCARKPAPSAPAPRYLVGPGYQADGAWFYPREDFHYDATGIATVSTTRKRTPNGLTANGELIDPTALTAAHQTLQLPAIVRVTNLENGLSLLVRVNDRGPASPSRIIALSPRAATLLHIDTAARVHITADEDASAALREQLQGGPRLAIAAAPRGAVTAEALAPPPGIGQSSRGRNAQGAIPASTASPSPERVPDRLPETLTSLPPQPGVLAISAGSFAQAAYANQVAARLAPLGARVTPQREGRATRYDVTIGPYASIAAADAALDQAHRAGVSDAAIVVE